MINKDDITIVICCAGMGTRLGIGSTKAVINIDGKPLIIRLLELLSDYSDIRIVVGYQAERVINVVTNYRKDIMFIFNYDYESTGLVQSISKALPYARKYIVEIDGDLVIDEENFNKFVEFEGECLGVNTINSSSPVCVKCEDGLVTEFSENIEDYEWTGLLKVQTMKFVKDGKNLYEVIKKILPLPYVQVDARDIDTAEDYEHVLKWYLEEKEKKEKL